MLIDREAEKAVPRKLRLKFDTRAANSNAVNSCATMKSDRMYAAQYRFILRRCIVGSLTLHCLHRLINRLSQIGRNGIRHGDGRLRPLHEVLLVRDELHHLREFYLGMIIISC